MIIGIGCDIIEHDLIHKLNWAKDTSIQQRIFSVEELDIFFSDGKISFLAGRFATKEAVLKCLGTGMQDGISLTDISIIKSSMGLPILKLKNQVLELAMRLGINNWHISISHSSTFTIAMAVAEN